LYNARKELQQSFKPRFVKYQPNQKVRRLVWIRNVSEVDYLEEHKRPPETAIYWLPVQDDDDDDDAETMQHGKLYPMLPFSDNLRESEMIRLFGYNNFLIRFFGWDNYVTHHLQETTNQEQGAVQRKFFSETKQNQLKGFSLDAFGNFNNDAVDAAWDTLLLPNLKQDTRSKEKNEDENNRPISVSEAKVSEAFAKILTQEQHKADRVEAKVAKDSATESKKTNNNPRKKISWEIWDDARDFVRDTVEHNETWFTKSLHNIVQFIKIKRRIYQEILRKYDVVVKDLTVVSKKLQNAETRAAKLAKTEEQMKIVEEEHETNVQRELSKLQQSAPMMFNENPFQNQNHQKQKQQGEMKSEIIEFLSEAEVRLAVQQRLYDSALSQLEPGRKNARDTIKKSILAALVLIENSFYTQTFYELRLSLLQIVFSIGRNISEWSQRDAYNNFLLTGAPGTGKTTSANIIATVLYRIGLIARSRIAELRVTDLISSYVGGTAILARNSFVKNLESVIFIDEAYTLTPSCADRSSDGTNNRQDKSYGRQSVNELMACMDEFQRLAIVIAAGYDYEMDCWIKTNPGLKRRFRTRIQLSNLSKNDIYNMVLDKLPAALDLDLDFHSDQLPQSLKTLIFNLIDEKDFPNQGGDVNVLMQTIAHTVSIDTEGWSEGLSSEDIQNNAIILTNAFDVYKHNKKNHY